MPITRDRFVRMVDHTLLRPEATGAEIAAAAEEGRQLGTVSVCVNGVWVGGVADVLSGSNTVPCAVVGFPLGAMVQRAKGVEAAFAVEHGAAEIDMVLAIGLARSGRWSDVESDISAVRGAIDPSTVLKVILETAVLEAHEIRSACEVAVSAGADFVKTSTGFHPAGGATPGAVAIMREAVGDTIGVKASGGIRTLADVESMIDAGATRLGLSATTAILAEMVPGS